jgi:cytochrome c-type biogenesis protein CcmH/NrfF
MMTTLVLAGLLALPSQAAPQEAPAPAPAGAVAQLPGLTPAQGRVVEETLIDRQTREISAQLRCVVCQGLSLQDSPSQLAQEMRSIVREKLEEGMEPAEVKAWFVEKYGEWVLLEPDPRGFNLVVYILPIAMFFGGAGFVFLKARSWTRQGEDGVALEEEEVGAGH